MTNKLLSLSEKYRPTRFEDFHGNDAMIESLKVSCRREQGPPNAFLLIGPTGCGKTTLARIIKNELKISDYDFTEYNGANARGIDTIRDIALKSQFSGLGGTQRVYFFDEVHGLTKDAQNAALKLLEDPNNHAIIICATTEEKSMLDTFTGRCTKFPVSLLSKEQIKVLITTILEKEKVTRFPKEAIEEIAEISGGSPREALILLDQVIDIPNDNDLLNAIRILREEYAEVSTPNMAIRKELFQALLRSYEWEDVVQILKVITEDPEKVRNAVLKYFNKVLMDSDNSQQKIKQAIKVIRYFSNSFKDSNQAGLTLACYLSVK